MLNVTVGIVGWRRPDYFEEVVKAICESRGYESLEYVISLDHSDKSNDHLDVISKYPLREKNPKVYIHTQRMGCAGNVGFTLGKCFENKQTDACIILEDDIVPSQDFFSYMLKMLEDFRDDKSVFTVGSFNRQDSVSEEQISQIIKDDGFTCWGWGTWRRVFEEVKDNWFGIHWNGKDGKVGDACPNGEDLLGYVNKHPTGSWAWPMKKYHRKGRYQIIPKVSRSQNIGREGGMFCPNGEWFDKNKQDTPIWMSSHFSEVYVDKFNLV
jgi:hypothetical protein